MNYVQVDSLRLLGDNQKGNRERKQRDEKSFP
jgi:hypothetical protein